MKKYWLSILISLFIILVIYFIFNFSALERNIRFYLTTSGFYKTETNVFNPDSFDLSQNNTYDAGDLIIYFPKDYEINRRGKSIEFFKDFRKVADLRVVNLENNPIVDYESEFGTILFSQNNSPVDSPESELNNALNFEDFLNKVVYTSNPEVVKNKTTYYITNPIEDGISEANFRKYKIGFYESSSEGKTIFFYGEDDYNNQIFIHSDTKFLVLARITTPNMEESVNLINLLLKTVTDNSSTTQPENQPQTN